MKKYIQPKIKAVSLNPDQAILAICALVSTYPAWTGGPGTYCNYATHPATRSTTPACAYGYRQSISIASTPTAQGGADSAGS